MTTPTLVDLTQQTLDAYRRPADVQALLLAMEQAWAAAGERACTSVSREEIAWASLKGIARGLASLRGMTEPPEWLCPHPALTPEGAAR